MEKVDDINNHKEKLLVKETKEDTVKEKEKATVKGENKAASFFQLQYALAKKIDIVIVAIALLGSIGMGCSMPVLAVLYGGTINTLGGPIDPDKFMDEMTTLCLRYVYIGLCVWVAAFFMTWMWSYNGRIISKRIKKEYFKLLMNQEQAFFDEVKPFEFATKIQAQLGDKIGQTLMSICMMITSFIVGFSYSWKLALVLLSGLPLLLIGAFFLIRNTRAISAKNREAYEHAGGIAEEVIYHIKTVASFSNYDFEVERFETKLKESLDAGLNNSLKSGISIGFLYFIVFASYALAIWYGSLLISNKEHNPRTDDVFKAGDVLTVLFTIVFGAVAFGQAAPNFKAITEAMNAAYDFFELKKRIPEIRNKGQQKPDKQEITGRIEFRNVSFFYKSKPEKTVLNGVNILMEPGKTTAIVGKSGMGKSTIVNIVERLYEVTQGSVHLDSYDITALDLEYYRSLIGYVPQEPVLFNTTIRDNIVFGREDISDEQVWEACQKAYADEFISKMEEGLDYVVGIKGSKLSGGQKQRIAIARAILNKPKILILDEATSALDNKSEKEVQKALHKVSQGVTTIVIAHRLSTVMHAHNILVVSDGKIAEEGNHKTLMERNEIYASLVKTQVGLVDDNQYGTVEDDTEERNQPLPQSKIVRKGSFQELQEKVEAEKAKKKEFESLANSKRKRLLPILGQFKGTVIFGAIAAACGGAVYPVYGILLADSINSLSKPNPEDVKHEGVKMAIFFSILAVGAGLSNMFQNFLFNAIGEYLAKNLRNLTFSKYLRLHIGFYDIPTNTPGTLTTQLASDTTKINQVALAMVGVSVQSVCTLTISITLGFVFDWRITLINLGFLPFIIFSSGVVYAIQKGFSSVDEVVEAAAGGVVSESVCNTKTIFSYNMQKRVVRMHKKILKNGFKSITKKSFVTGILFGFTQLLTFVTYSALYYSGASFMSKGTLSLQDMMRSIFVLLFASFGLGNAQQYVGDLSSAKASLVNIFKTLDEPSSIDPIEIKERTDPPALRPQRMTGKIEFRNVSFAYPSRPDVIVFENLNFTILPGQRAAFVGKSGSGKSTIVQLIQRFYDVTAGEILIDDVNIKDYDLFTLRSFISIVMQEPILFKRDVFENIRYGKLSATDEEVVNAARSANISHFLTPENKGKILEVSGGEKQRIAIARAIIKNPPILLLDEATSALDGNVEKEIQQCLETLMPGRTSITIAHKLITVVSSDVIFVMESGQILEQGSHNDLLDKRGVYFNLFNAGHSEL